MTDFVWPNGVRISSCEWRPVSNTEYTPETFGGGAQTSARPGDKMACRVRVNNSSGAERRKLRSLVHVLRGRGNRLFLPDYSFTRAGSFPAPELLSNYEFSNTSGWTPGSRYTLTASDGVLRATVANGNAAAGVIAGQVISTTQYAPHAIRALVAPGRGAWASSQVYRYIDSLAWSAFSNAAGYGIDAPVVNASGNNCGLYDASASGMTAGDFIEIPFISASRCFLVDGGANLLLRSDAIDNASWTKTRSSVTGSAADPFGTSLGDVLTEDTSNNSHYATQSVTGLSSAAADYAFAVCARSNGRNFIALSMDEATGATSVAQYFNLSTGAVGSNGSTGANWSNRRSFVVDLGNAWFMCVLVARKTNAATQIGCTVSLASADGTGSYLGNGSNAVSLFRASLSQSSVPSRLTATAAAAVAAQTQSSQRIYVKGLPASTAGLLKVGDLVEISNVIYPIASDLNSDAAGGGYLQLAFPPPRALTNDTPIVVCRPMGKMILMNDPEIPCVPGGFSDFEFDFVQDLAA
jgi:hypothetical protein